MSIIARFVCAVLMLMLMLVGQFPDPARAQGYVEGTFKGARIRDVKWRVELQSWRFRDAESLLLDWRLAIYDRRRASRFRSAGP